MTTTAKETTMTKAETITATKTTTIRVPAAQYVDYDDSLAAAAEAYVEEHPEADGWDLGARWEDDDRDVILLDVPTVTTYIVHSCKTGRAGIPAATLEEAKRLAVEHDEEYQPAGGTDIRDASGVLVETVGEGVE